MFLNSIHVGAPWAQHLDFTHKFSAILFSVCTNNVIYLSSVYIQSKQTWYRIIYTIILFKSVCMYVCRCSQTAGRNSCSIVSGDVSNCSYRLTVHPVTSSHLSSTLFYMRKTLKTSGKPGHQCQCLFQWPAISYCHKRSGPSRLSNTDPSNSDTATAVCVWGGVCTRSRGCVRTRVRPFIRACMRACVMCLQYTIIIFDPGC